MAVIDVHTHVVPRALADLPTRHRLWPTLQLQEQGRAAVVVDGKIFRQIDSRSWDVERRIEDMLEDGTDLQVLSPMPELLSHWLPAALADHLSAIMNDQIAEMVARAPSRFRGIGMVPMQDVDLATRRLDTLSERNFCGVEIGTHIDGVPLGDPRFTKFYGRAEDLGLMLFIHPLHPTGLERVGGPRELAAVASFPGETALAATSLIAGQILEKFPKLRILLSHGGGALAWIAPRIEFARKATSSVGNALSEPMPQTLKRFWYDTIVYETEPLRFLSDSVGIDRLVIGSDYPFAIRQSKPGAFSHNALPNAPFEDNTIALLDGPALPTK